MDMPPELKDLSADFAFKARDQSRRNNHHGYAQRHGHDGNTDNQPGKIPAAG